MFGFGKKESTERSDKSLVEQFGEADYDTTLSGIHTGFERGRKLSREKAIEAKPDQVELEEDKAIAEIEVGAKYGKALDQAEKIVEESNGGWWRR